jgi:Sulfotransferase family
VPHQQSSLPRRFRLLNMVGKSLRGMSLPVARFDEGTVHEAAMKESGLTDFGDPHYREGLLRLLESAETDADLHFIGRLAIREVITNALVSRLLLMDARIRTPEVFERPLRPPIIVLGLPRSGTTFLHRMLAADPAHRAIPLWELLRPLPNADSSVSATPDRRRQIAEQRLALRLKLAPDLDSKHYVRANTPEECMWLLAATFVSPVFWVVAPVFMATWTGTRARIVSRPTKNTAGYHRSCRHSTRRAASCSRHPATRAPFPFC